MFDVGDRVCLVKDVGAFEAGSEGVVVMVENGDVVVHIDKDALGNNIEPFPLPPLPADEYFRPAKFCHHND